MAGGNGIATSQREMARGAGRGSGQATRAWGALAGMTGPSRQAEGTEVVEVADALELLSFGSEIFITRRIFFFPWGLGEQRGGGIGCF